MSSAPSDPGRPAPLPPRTLCRRSDDLSETALRVIAQQVAVELVLADLRHRPAGQHFRHPGVVVRVVVDDLSQGHLAIRLTHAELRRHLHAPLVVADLLYDVVERSVGHDEHVLLGHDLARFLLDEMFGGAPRVATTRGTTVRPAGFEPAA